MNSVAVRVAAVGAMSPTAVKQAWTKQFGSEPPDWPPSLMARAITYLLAGVEVVATYKVYGVNCQKLESLIHKVFGAAQINLSIPDRFGHIVKPREWFLVPLHVINEAVDRIRDRSIVSYRYDPQAGQLKPAQISD